MIVPNQKNIKVHFAATENINQNDVVKSLGVNYALYTAYPFIERVVFEKPKRPIIAGRLKGAEQQIPQDIIQSYQHTIQDSGLFTLMFGSQKGAKDKKFLDLYFDTLVDFTLKNSFGATIVEMDTQKVLGVNSAWEYRLKMRNLVPNRIINVFHIEDGQDGLDRLIEFSDYIAISVPELRFSGNTIYLEKIANYIKNKKPDIDIHLLGCTEKKFLTLLNFCTSCDSSSYTSGIRYGYIGGNKISEIDFRKVKNLISIESYNKISAFLSERVLCGLILNAYTELQKYTKYAGCQD